MDLRDSISRPFKNLKHRFAKGSRKRKEGSGREDGREWREHDTEGGEAGQSSRPHPETGGVAEGGRGREEHDDGSKRVVQVDPATFTPLTLHGESGKSNSM